MLLCNYGCNCSFFERVFMSAAAWKACDAVVLGGGVVGCSTAFALAQRGLSVTLIERASQVYVHTSTHHSLPSVCCACACAVLHRGAMVERYAGMLTRTLPAHIISERRTITSLPPPPHTQCFWCHFALFCLHPDPLFGRTQLCPGKPRGAVL